MKPIPEIVFASVALVPTAGSAAVPQTPTFEQALAKLQGVTPLGKPQPLVLYSWTTKEQADAIRKGGAVLTRSKSPTKGYATFDQWLSRYATKAKDRSYALEKVLFSKGFARKRFAWPNALGAIQGLGDGSYGNVLLRIELRPESTFVAASLDGALLASTADGSTIDSVEPSSIGAVRFTTDTFREYVVLNESMIASVSIATPEIAEHLQLELALLNSIDMSNQSHIKVLGELMLELNPVITKEVVEERKVALSRAISQLGGKPYHREVTSPFVLGSQRAAIPNRCKYVVSAMDREIELLAQRSTFALPYHTAGKCSPTCALEFPQATACVPDPSPGK
jgi:hypothetical protein